MAFEVVFTKKADDDFESILNYIQKDFGINSGDHFKKLIDEFIKLVRSFPEIGSMELSHKSIRGFVIQRRLKIFYRIKNNNIIILRLFDTRQHPDVNL